MHGKELKVDVVVYGGTPAGVMAALAAARMGHKVALLDTHAHFGGMAASGLGKSDIEKRAYIGGCFTEFTNGVLAYYQRKYGCQSTEVQSCKEGYYYEPHVAETVFESMIAQEQGIESFKRHRLTNAQVDGGAITAITVLDMESDIEGIIHGQIFIDAGYEGDLYAAAGAEFRLGRESRDEYDESLAGYIYYDYENGAMLPGSTGAADDGLPAWTYRLFLSMTDEKAVPLVQPPKDYTRSVYTPYFDDLEAGLLSAPKVMHAARGYYPDHFDTLVRALSVTPMAGGKADVNINPRPLAFPFPEENKGYLEGNWDTRMSIEEKHRNLCLGLLWFLQHDEEVPVAHRSMARQFNLPVDEFQDNGHFPWQLYIREARRLKGCYTITQHDVSTTSGSIEPMQHEDVIAMGEFPIDSFPVHKKQVGDSVVLEGYLGMLGHLTKPYAIPYRAMVPIEVDGLIVPGALSASHVAYSSVRMEPTWMALGYAAGMAAHEAIKSNCPPRAVPVDSLRDNLRQHGQVVDTPVHV